MMGNDFPLRACRRASVGIVGEDTMVEDILGVLLRDAGYDARIIDVSVETGGEDPFAELDVLLFSSGTDDCWDRLDDFQCANGAATPVVGVPPALRIAVLDDMAFTVTWRALFENLLMRIEAALARSSAEPA